MKKYFVTALVFLATTAAFAQKKQPKPPPPTTDSVAAVNKAAAASTPASTTTGQKPKKDWSKVKISNKRPADHFMFQFAYDNWANVADSMHIQGFNRSANFYFMYNFPFKTDPRLSIGVGLGIGSSNIFFHQQEVLVAALNPPNQTLAFPDQSGGYHFKKYKLVTTYLEAPIELRYAVDPENMDHTWKFAVGAKVGLLMSAYTKAKDLQNPAGQTVGSYIEKESSKQFFNTPKLAATARVSYGVVGIFGQFQVNPLIKATAGPPVYPFSIGLTLSGL